MGIDDKDLLFKRVLKAYRNCNNPKLNRFEVCVDNGVAYVEGRADGVYVEIDIRGEEYLKHFLGTAIAAANFLDCYGAIYRSIQEVE